MPAPAAINIEDEAQLARYLRDAGWVEPKETLRFTALDGGVSNRAVLVERERGADWVVKQALSKLRVPVDWFSAPQRIEREAAGLRWLRRLMPERAPQLVFHDPTRHILAMRAIPQPHANWKRRLLAGRTERDHARQFGWMLARIHNAILDYPQLENDFGETRFFEELRLEPYYGYTAQQVPGSRAFLQRLIAETRKRRFALVHGDYSPKNVLVRAGRLHLLDFEVIHFGDPAFDIGFSLTHFLSKAHHMPHTRAEMLDLARVYWRGYLENLDASQRDRAAERAVAHTLACLMARVAGRSPLEYLDGRQRARQLSIALALIDESIRGIPQLIDAFAERLEANDE